MNAPENSTLDWQRLLPERGYRSSMAVRRGISAAEYFNQPGDAALCFERQHWLSETPSEYTGINAGAVESLAEFSGFAADWLSESERAVDGSNAFESCVQLGKKLAPDWVLLKADASGVFRLEAGAVCFPSSWALRDKLGKPMEAIHEPVPGLNQQLGSRIQSFLSALPAEEPWERSNVSFSGNTELNHHPSRKLPRLGAHSTLANAWLRFERQFFFRLPRTGAIVFGIRITHHQFEALAADPLFARRLAHALETMSDELTVYKGMVEARQVLIEQLKRAAQQT